MVLCERYGEREEEAAKAPNGLRRRSPRPWSDEPQEEGIKGEGDKRKIKAIGAGSSVGSESHGITR